jgi:hypothetical protein
MSSASAVGRRRTRELEPLVGLSAIDAIARLRALELRPAVEPCEGGPEDHGLVLAQEPVAGIDVARGQLVTLIVGEQHTRCGDTAHRDAAASRITQSPWSSHEIMGGAAVHIARLPTRIRPTSEPRAEEAAPTSASEAAEFTPITPAGLVRTLPDEAPDRDPTATEDRVVGLEPRRTAAWPHPLEDPQQHLSNADAGAAERPR